MSGERSGPQDLLETRSPLRTRKLPLLFVRVGNGRREVQGTQSRVHPLLERKDGEKLGWKRMQRRSPLRQGCGDGALQHLRSIVPRRLLENDRGTPYQQKQSLDPHTQTDKFRTQKRQVPICRTIGQRAADSRESVEVCAKGRGYKGESEEENKKII